MSSLVHQKGREFSISCCTCISLHQIHLRCQQASYSFFANFLKKDSERRGPSYMERYSHMMESKVLQE